MGTSRCRSDFRAKEYGLFFFFSCGGERRGEGKGGSYRDKSKEPFSFPFKAVCAKWTWNKGRKYCKNEIGTDYFAINTKSKSLRLEALAIEEENAIDLQAWIGLTDAAEEGVWEWIDGSPTNSYHNWREGDPILHETRHNALINFGQSPPVWAVKGGAKKLTAIVCERMKMCFSFHFERSPPKK